LGEKKSADSQEETQIDQNMGPGLACGFAYGTD
jgi:hypothetical protein